jgi:protocatechuate 3,4-dioxygenase beta subunit
MSPYDPLFGSLSRRELTRLSLLVMASAPWRVREERKVHLTADGEPDVVEAPGEIPPELRRRVEELGAALAAETTTTNEVLADPGSNELRPYPLFRDLIAKHAPTGRAVLVPRGEPGLSLLLALRVARRDGTPYGGARVYAYQTSAKGWYAAEAPQITGAGSPGHARLFTHGVTDADGQRELVTIQPVGYPRSTLPSHIHVWLEGGERESLHTEVRFADCPRMTPDEIESSLRAGLAIVEIEKGDGNARGMAEFELSGG